MSQEIVDAVRVLGREKGISEEKLMIALEDALLSPDAATAAALVSRSSPGVQVNANA